MSKITFTESKPKANTRKVTRADIKAGDFFQWRERGGNWTNKSIYLMVSPHLREPGQAVCLVNNGINKSWFDDDASIEYRIFSSANFSDMVDEIAVDK